VHAALERFVAGRRDRGAWPLSGDAADRAEARAAAEAVMERFEAEGRVGDPRVWAARREAVLARIDRFVAAEARLADGLAPRLLEHRFGGPSGRPPLVLRDGAEEVRLAGRIDRVDAGGERLLVIDYKNARNGRELAGRLEPEALGVTSFQAPVYLMAAARELPGRSQLAAVYALLRSGERTTALEVAAGDGLLALDEARRAEARAAGGRPVADAVLSAVRRIRRGEFPIASRDCAGCGFGAVCRFQSLAEAEP
jgi:ATP-dependent helicase/DNAse subunit B